MARIDQCRQVATDVHPRVVPSAPTGGIRSIPADGSVAGGRTVRADRRDAADLDRRFGFGDTVLGVDVRIGVTQAPRELTVEVTDEERDELVPRVEAALSGASDVLWVTDKRGRRIAVPSAKIAYVELGAPEGDRRIGFGG